MAIRFLALQDRIAGHRCSSAGCLGGHARRAGWCRICRANRVRCPVPVCNPAGCPPGPRPLCLLWCFWSIYGGLRCCFSGQWRLLTAVTGPLRDRQQQCMTAVAGCKGWHLPCGQQHRMRGHREIQEPLDAVRIQFELPNAFEIVTSIVLSGNGYALYMPGANVLLTPYS